jgi:hypothetical protein
MVLVITLVPDSTLTLWTHPDWTARAHNWIRAELEKQGVQATGPPEQPHIRPWSTVLHVPTDVGMLYFKASTAALRHEAALTRILAGWLPESMPRVLAADAERGWLLLADGGMRLRDVLKSDPDIRHWERPLSVYAGLQIECSGRVDSLLRVGLPDRRLAKLPALFEALLNDSDGLGLGRRDGLSPEEYQRLKGFYGLLERLCEQLAAYAIPETLDHGDFHDGNIFVQNGRYLLFDWGDSSVTHPFFSLRATLVSLEHTLGLTEASRWLERLATCYLDPWTAYETMRGLEAAYRLSQRLAPIIAALRWRAALSGADVNARSSYGYAIPSLLRELLALNESV